MLFPKGQVVYENLNTSFTQLDAMLSDLKSVQFTGYVQLTAWEYEGILLFDTGNIVNAIEDSKGQRRHGPSAAEGIAMRGREKDGALDVYRLSPEMTQLLANLFNSQAIYKDLDSDLTSLDKLVAKMQSEKLTGYIEIKMPKSQNAGTIFMRDGQVLDSVFSNKGNMVSGSKVAEQIIQAAAAEPSTFTVFRADLTAVYSDNINLTDSFARESKLTFWQDVLKTFEATVDAGTKPGTFLTAFKRASIDTATAYPFLDPFAAEFEYKEGNIKFSGQATIAEFNEGLSRVLELTLDKFGLTPSLKTAATTLKEKYRTKVEEVGLVEVLPDLFK
jgi:hypothetical protein